MKKEKEERKEIVDDYIKCPYCGGRAVIKGR